MQIHKSQYCCPICGNNMVIRGIQFGSIETQPLVPNMGYREVKYELMCACHDVVMEYTESQNINLKTGKKI